MKWKLEFVLVLPQGGVGKGMLDVEVALPSLNCLQGIKVIGKEKKLSSTDCTVAIKLTEKV